MSGPRGSIVRSMFYTISVFPPVVVSCLTPLSTSLARACGRYNQLAGLYLTTVNLTGKPHGSIIPTAGVYDAIIIMGKQHLIVGIKL